MFAFWCWVKSSADYLYGMYVFNACILRTLPVGLCRETSALPAGGVPLVRRELERLLRVLLPGHVLLRAEGAASAVRPCA